MPKADHRSSQLAAVFVLPVVAVRRGRMCRPPCLCPVWPLSDTDCWCSLPTRKQRQNERGRRGYGVTQWSFRGVASICRDRCVQPAPETRGPMPGLMAKLRPKNRYLSPAHQVHTRSDEAHARLESRMARPGGPLYDLNTLQPHPSH